MVDVVGETGVEQAFVFGINAENALGEEMRHLLRVETPVAHGIREL